MQDPHVRDLLRKSTTSERAASREEAKLAQLEVDSRTPLYDGCDPEVTRLSFTLELLKTKAKNKWTDKSVDEHLKYLIIKFFSRGTCSLLVSRRPRKLFALLICRTLGTTHASTIASFIGGSTRKKLAAIVQCFSIQEGRKESSSESCMVVSDHSSSAAVFRRS